jgi:hypothetical protein
MDVASAAQFVSEASPDQEYLPHLFLVIFDFSSSF